MSFIPSGIIFINNDLTNNTRNYIVRQLYITDVITGDTFDNNVTTIPGYVNDLKLANKRVLVERSFINLNNKELADLVLFVKNGFVSVQKNNFGPPGQSYGLSKITWGKLGVFNAAASSAEINPPPANTQISPSPNPEPNPEPNPIPDCILPISDSFNDDILDPQWTSTIEGSMQLTESLGLLSITFPPSPTGIAYTNIKTTAQYDLTDCSTLVEVYTLPSASTLAYANFVVEISAGNLIEFFMAGGDISAYLWQTGSPTQLVTTTYNANQHKWLRIREQSGTLFWDTSGDGYEPWVNFASIASPFSVQSVSVVLGAGYFQAETNPGVASFDNFNLAPPNNPANPIAPSPLEPPNSYSNSVLWVDVDKTIHSGNGTKISAATDQSLAEATIVEGAANAGPIYYDSRFGSSAAMLFDDDWLKVQGTGESVVDLLNGQSAGTKDFTVILVGQILDSQNNYFWSFSKSTISSRYIASRSNTNAYTQQIIGGTTSGTQSTISNTDYWNPSPQIYIYRYDGANDIHRVDGVNSASVPRAWAGNYDVDTFVIGGVNSPSPTVANNLLVTDVVVFNRALTDNEAAEWDGYFAEKRGIALNWKENLGATGDYLVIAMLGQSNMAGGCLGTQSYDFTASDSYMLGLDGQYKVLSEPTHDSTNKVTTLGYTNSVIGASAAGKIAEQLRLLGETRTLLFVPCALGATDSPAWKVNLTSSPPTINDLIGFSKHRISEALKAPGASLIILYDQGEANADNITEANYWDEDWDLISSELNSFFAGKFDKAVKFIQGRLSLNIAGVGAFAANVRTSQDNLAAARLDTEQVQRPDGTCEANPGLHLTATEQQAYGVLLANKIYSLPTTVSPDKPTLTFPTDGYTVLMGRDITVSATSPNTDIDRIEWILNPGIQESLVATDSTSPYSQLWNPAPSVSEAGMHTLVARAFYGDGYTDSDPVNINLIVTAASFFDASSVIHHIRMDLGVTNDADGVAIENDRVKNIEEQFGGPPFTQTTPANQPLYKIDATHNNRPYISLDSNARHMTTTFTTPAPGTTPTSIWAMARINAWANGSRIISSTDSLKKLIYCNGSSPQISIYNNSARFSTPATVGQLDRWYAYFSATTADALNIGDQLDTGLNAGAAGADAGRVLGNITSGTNNALPDFFEQLYLNRSMTLLERSATTSYANAWYGLSLTPPTPPSLSLDVPALGLGHGTVLSGSLTPQTGPDITPQNSPTIDEFGIAGRSAIRLKSASLQYFLATELAPIAYGQNQPFSCVVRLRRANPVGEMVVLGFGISGYSTDNYIECYLPGGNTLPALRINAFNDSEYKLESSDTNTTPFLDHVLAFTWDGTTAKTYLNGILVDTLSVSTEPFVITNCAIGAAYRTAPNNYFDGWIQNIEIQPVALTQSDIIDFETLWRAADGNSPGIGSKIAWVGDSLTEASSDTTGAGGTFGGGMRSRVTEYARQNELKVDSVGQFKQGFFQDPEHMSHGGYQIQNVTADALLQLGTDNPYPSVELLFVMAGTNNMVPLELGSTTLSAVDAAYTTMLNTLHSQITSTVPDARIVVTTIPPIQTGVSGATVVASYNASLTAIWDAFDAANPNNKLFRWDSHAASGGAWSSALFKDSAHWNGDGFDAIVGSLTTPGTAGICLLDATDGYSLLRDHLINSVSASYQIANLKSLYIAGLDEQNNVAEWGDDSGNNKLLAAINASFIVPFSVMAIDAARPGLQFTNRYLEAATASDWTFLHQDAGFTVIAYIYPTSALNGQIIASTRSNSLTSEPGFFLHFDGGNNKLGYAIYNDSGTLVCWVTTSNDDVIEGSPYTVVIRVGASQVPKQGTMRVNGVELAAVDFTGAVGTGAAPRPLELGYSIGSGTNHFSGASGFGIFAIYDSILSDAEVMRWEALLPKLDSQRITRRIRCLGDSITAGAQSHRRKLQMRITRSKRWRAQMVGSFGPAINFPAQDGDHDGVSGETISQIRARIAGGPECDDVVLLAGTNNMGSGDPATHAAEIGTAITELQAEHPNANIYVLAIPYGDGTVPASTLGGAAGTFNSLLPAICESAGVIFVDIHSGPYAWNVGTDASDGVGHPTPAGGDAIGNSLAVAMGIGGD